MNRAHSPKVHPILVIDVSVEGKDRLSTTLVELGAESIEQRDATVLTTGTPGRVTLIARFSMEASVHSAANALESSFHPQLVELARIGPEGGAILSEILVGGEYDFQAAIGRPSRMDQSSEWLALVMRQSE